MGAILTMAILTVAILTMAIPNQVGCRIMSSNALRYLVITPPRWAAASCPTSSGASPLCTACSRARGPATCWQGPSAAPVRYLVITPKG